jgi:hypothetical protein
MEKIKSRLVITKEDYEIIMYYIKRGLPTITFNRQNA